MDFGGLRYFFRLHLFSLPDLASLTWQAFVKTVYVSYFEDNFRRLGCLCPTLCSQFSKSDLASVFEECLRSSLARQFSKSDLASIFEECLRSSLARQFSKSDLTSIFEECLRSSLAS